MRLLTVKDLARKNTTKSRPSLDKGIEMNPEIRSNPEG